MARGKKIAIRIPSGFHEIDDTDMTTFVFDYLIEIKFSRHWTEDYINLSDTSRLLYKPYFEKLEYGHSFLPDDEILGGFYMLHKCFPDVYSYENFCKTVIEFRGGFSIHYKKVAKETEVFDFRDKAVQWIEDVMTESEEEFDIDVRRAEYLDIKHKLRKFATGVETNSRVYQTILMPASVFQKTLNQVRKRIFND